MMKGVLRVAALLICGLIVAAAPAYSATASAQTPATFHFAAIKSLDDMHHFIESNYPAGSPREALRRAFVDQGGATLKLHPTQAGVEKYIYDINLCSYYVWRWNISADFDGNGRLVQAYVNGEPVFATGTQKKSANDLKKGHQSIFKVRRPRPEASKGESQLSYLVLDADSDMSTIDDQLAMGGGPTRVDPVNMGTLHAYSDVEPWRSIFDKDDADRIVAYPGDCKEADERARQQVGTH